MPFDAGGTFTRSYNWQGDRDAGIKILAQRMDGEFNNYAGGLNQTFLRTGIVPMGGPLNMNSNPIVGIAGGTLISPGLRFATDTDTGLMQSGPGNLQIVVDGVAQLVAASTGITIGADFTVNSDLGVSGSIQANGAITAIAPGLGGINLLPGNATVSGYITFTNSANALIAYIGQTPNANNGPINYFNAGGHTFVNGLVTVQNMAVNGRIDVGQVVSATQGFYADASFFMAVSGGAPLINFDANDFIRFNRAGNYFEHVVGGVNNFTVSASSVQVGVPAQAVMYMGSGNSYLAADPISATWLMAPNYYMQLDRNTNIMSLVMGTGSVALDVRPASIQLNRATNVGASLSAQGVIRTSNGGIGNVLLQAGNASVSGFVAFLATNDTVLSYIGQQASGGPLEYNTAAGHRFTGPINAGDYIGTGAVKAFSFYPGNDVNFYLYMSGVSPLIGLDASDFLVYDRVNNQLNLSIGGAYPFTVSPTGVTSMGIPVGYREIPFRTVDTPGGNIGGGDLGKGILFLPGASNYGVPDLGQNAVVTVANRSNANQTLVQAGATIVWSGTGGNVILSPWALASIVWIGAAHCIVSGQGVFR